MTPLVPRLSELLSVEILSLLSSEAAIASSSSSFQLAFALDFFVSKNLHQFRKQFCSNFKRICVSLASCPCLCY
jgi:hypothetical protein